MDRKKELEREIKKHNKLFWELNEPEISDPEYDKLVRELRGLDQSNEVINKINTPSINSGKKIKHKLPMLSLDKVYTVEDLIAWANKNKRSDDEEFVLENKFDGWSVEKKGEILSTRGDGYEGDDISNKLVYVKLLNGNNIESVDYSHGELVMLKSDFEKNEDKILRKSGVKYKTPRTILTGLLTKDDVRDLESKKVLTFIPFDEFQIRCTFDRLKHLDWGVIIECSKKADYPTDGLVLKLVDKEYAESLGSTSHHLRSAMALKFTNPTGITKLIDVIWSLGKHKLTPVGKVDPVEIGGVTVVNINLHNYKYVLDNDIYIGDTLVVERCGDIIPDVQKVIPGDERIPITLETCPACEGVVAFNHIEMVCTNPDCIGKIVRRMVDSVVRIGIERLGEPTIAKLVDAGCSNLIDIFNLSKDDIINLERFGESSSENLYNEIQKVKNDGVFEWQILASLNIHGVGKRMSKMVLKDFELSNLRDMSVEQLKDIEGVGPERAIEIYLNLRENDGYINGLLEILPIKIEGVEEEMGGTICFTGKMPEKRSYYEKLAKEIGYDAVSRVTKDLTLLVCADVNSTFGKTKKAKKYGIEIMHIDKFIKQF